MYKIAVLVGARVFKRCDIMASSRVTGDSVLRREYWFTGVNFGRVSC